MLKRLVVAKAKARLKEIHQVGVGGVGGERLAACKAQARREECIACMQAKS